MKNLAKVAVIGAGNVGATTALMIAQIGLADIVLLDIAENMAKAKAIDISHALAAQNSDVQVTAVKDYKDIGGSCIVIVTAGFPRKPGMSRDDLLKANAEVVKGIAHQIKKNAPSAIVIVVTNPLDVMTYLVYKVTGFNHAKVFGMAGVLDSARLADFIAARLNAKRSDVDAMVLGSHGDLMLPVFTHTKASGKPLPEVLSQKDLRDLAELTKDSGAKIVSLLGTGSAYYGPAASVTQMVRAVLTDAKTTHCVCAYLQGEYGLRDVYIGVPCVLGRHGIENIVQIKLTQEEARVLSRAADSIKVMIGKLDY
jgi:malate dehydrogenase